MDKPSGYEQRSHVVLLPLVHRGCRLSCLVSENPCIYIHRLWLEGSLSLTETPDRVHGVSWQSELDKMKSCVTWDGIPVADRSSAVIDVTYHGFSPDAAYHIQKPIRLCE